MQENEPGYTEGFLQDQELLAKHRAGDPRAYGELFEKYRRVAFSYAHKYVKTNEQAEDLVLEAFTRILETIRRGKGPTVSMGHYLVSTIRSVAINGGIRDSHEEASAPEEVARLYEREQFDDTENTSGWLSEAFNSLSPRSQQVMWYRVVEGITSREIARMMGLSPVAVTRSYQAAVRQFREEFVTVSLAESRGQSCVMMVPQLRKLAAQDGNKRDAQPSAELAAHLSTCPHCSVVESRLRGSDRVLLSIVFLTGLGAFAADSLSTTSVSGSFSSLLGGLSVPVKIVLVAVPIIGASIAGIAITQMWTGTSNAQVSSVVLGETPRNAPGTLLRVGTCELQREPLDQQYEVWRLSKDNAECNTRIGFQPVSEGVNGSEQAAVVILDTSANQNVRAAEITRPGVYTVTVSDGADTEQVIVTVKQ